MSETPANMVAPLPRWLHIWAVLTVLAALGAMTGGTVVTTLRVGMADPVWPTYPWHLALISWDEPSPGFLIEHTHRALAYAAGFCVVVLTIGLWWTRSLPWLRYTCLIAIVVQGLLGGFRVRLDAWLGSDLKLIHGSFAEVVFALAVSAAVATSRSWREPADLADQQGAESLRRASLLCMLAVFGQIVLGGFVRHTNSSLGQRGHLLVAFLVVATVAWLVHRAVDAPVLEAPLRRAVWCLAGLLALQILLGVETWMTKFVPGVFPDTQPVTVRQAIIRTAHYVVGSGVFGFAVVTSLRAYRQALALKTRPVPHLGGLEGAL
ncbi:MAG TPA: COX15/CtaA family protein [Gemmataceae bacterium]|nr:COX15/CtaA family protein [Gemmataceae bacterium]